MSCTLELHVVAKRQYSFVFVCGTSCHVNTKFIVRMEKFWFSVMIDVFCDEDFRRVF